MIDIATALLFSNWWFVGRRVIEPMTDYRIALRYGYEGGYADGYNDAVTAADNSRVVPLMPPDRSSRIDAANGSRSRIGGYAG